MAEFSAASLPAQRDVLDHGFVRLVDVMGDDASIVQAARVSYGAGTKNKRDDAALIDYLMRHEHTSPFELVTFKFHVKAPLFVMRQWQRHRTASLNEISARYSEMPDEFYLPEAERVQAQSQSNKQGSDASLPEASRAAFLQDSQQSSRDSYARYETHLQDGVARELARINLPVSLYSEMYWQINLHNLLHFLRLRMDSHAQYEIRVYAEAMAAFVQERCPVAYASFVEHRLQARRFSASEMALLRQLVDVDKLEHLAKDSGMRKSRVHELLAKFASPEPSSEVS